MLPISIAVADALHLVVDTQARELRVMNGSSVRLRLRDVAIGRFGATADRKRGDGTTPIGEYRISGLRVHDSFHFFIDIDYPSVEDARRGYASGLISLAEKRAIERAHRRGVQPPQNTALGGHLGIHGVGDGDPEVHRAYNWTHGCVALEDWQIDELRPLLRVGMPVKIR
jgi:murein L,D-transpeptidase YafK